MMPCARPFPPRRFPSLVLAACVLGTGAARAQTALTTERVASGLSAPLLVTAPPDDPERLFIVEQGGVVRLLKNGSLLPTPFLDLSNITHQGGGERGLLGMAFRSDYATSGVFFVSYNRRSDGATMVRRYLVSGDPDVADPSSNRNIFGPLAQPFSNHNGGGIAIGPDSKLYLALGDGGSANDPGCRAQDGSTQLGKLLRMDVLGGVPADNPFVDDPGFDDLIWAYGLRNPWRFSFDRLTGDLYIADVGQFDVEEINFVPAGGSGGENFGWKMMEGDQCAGTANCTSVPPCNDASLTDPVLVYTHNLGCSVTGGYVYRGCAIPDLQGTYFYADYCSARIWSFKMVAGAVTEFQNRTSELDPPGALAINSVTSFGEDALGELYIVDGGGEIFRIIPQGGVTDANTNGIADTCEATSTARNGTGLNPVVFARLDEPRLGHVWNCTIELGTASATGVIFALGGPASGPIVNGTLNGEILGSPPYSGLFQSATGTHALPIPLDLSLLGLGFPALGMTFSGQRIVLTNALDLTLGL